MPEALILIATFSHPFEAHLAKGKLESEGIEAFIADENIVGLNWLYSNLVGGVKLKVHEEDRERALKVLQAKVPLLGGSRREKRPTSAKKPWKTPSRSMTTVGRNPSGASLGLSIGCNESPKCPLGAVTVIDSKQVFGEGPGKPPLSNHPPHDQRRK
jgi:hypothetical protein